MMRIPVTVHSLAAAGWLVLSAPAASAELGVYGMTGISFTQMHSTVSNTGSQPTGSGERAVGFRVAIGYQGEPSWAFECTLGGLGRADAQAGGNHASWSVSGYGCGGLYLVPSDERTRWFIKGAMQRPHMRAEGNAFARTEQVTSTSPALTAGVWRSFSRSAGWRLEYERVFNVGDASRTGKFELGTFLASLYYGFN